jgi:hypothetical protein
MRVSTAAQRRMHLHIKRVALVSVHAYTDRSWVRIKWSGLVAVHAHVRLPCVEGDRQDVPRLRVAVYSLAVSVLQAARDFNASSSRGGSVLPRRSARRRIPAHAFWLK